MAGDEIPLGGCPLSLQKHLQSSTVNLLRSVCVFVCEEGECKIRFIYFRLFRRNDRIPTTDQGVFKLNRRILICLTKISNDYSLSGKRWTLIGNKINENMTFQT